MGQGAPRPRRHTTTAIAVALTALLALTGCTTEPEPTPTTPTGTSTTPTPTPTPTETTPAPPQMPAEMDRGDETGAIAAAEYFMQLFGYVMTTGDLAAWDAVCHAECVFCNRVSGDVRAVYAAGGSFTGGTVTTSEVVAGPQHPTLGGFPVSLNYTVASGAEIDSDGAVVEDLPAEQGTAVLDVQRTPAGWVLVELSDDPGYSVFTQ